jgi:hypothetical protein
MTKTCITKTYIVAAARIVLSLAAPGAAQASTASAACMKNDQRTECSAPSFARGVAVVLARRTTPAHPRFHGAEHPIAPPPASLRSSDHIEDPLASMHFE